MSIYVKHNLLYLLVFPSGDLQLGTHGEEITQSLHCIMCQENSISVHNDNEYCFLRQIAHTYVIGIQSILPIHFPASLCDNNLKY